MNEPYRSQFQFSITMLIFSLCLLQYNAILESEKMEKQHRCSSIYNLMPQEDGYLLRVKAATILSVTGTGRER
uniref:Putative secreted protein n=1 Tax=Rhipicephalus microplus TaxID=6941 RepID=A0A6M2DBK6_RHIMP